MITLSIDVTLLDKKRFKETIRANGKKAIFANLVLIETPNGQYGDFMVKQDTTKEERAAKVEMPILGNGRHVGARGQQPDQRPPAAQPAPPAGRGGLPF
jgi:hypothetical protein